MNSAQAFLVAVALCAFGGALIYLGVYVVVTYGEHFRRDPSKVMLWDVIACIALSPSSPPVVVAGLSIALGALVLMLGASIAVFILAFQIGRLV